MSSMKSAHVAILMIAVTLMFWVGDVHAQGYSLGNLCKSVDGWRVLKGNCDSSGMLQGAGEATMDGQGIPPRTIFSGNFVDGKPDGPHQMFFCTVVSPRCAKRDDHEIWGRCNITFRNKAVSNEEISCSFNDGTLVVKPGSGRINWRNEPHPMRSTPMASIEIDLPEIEWRGPFTYSSVASVLSLRDRRTIIVGKADRFILDLHKSTSFIFEGFSGSAKSDEIVVSGVFSFKCPYCSLSGFVYASLDSDAVDERSLVRVSLNNKGVETSYKIVYFNDGEVLYFESSDGLVFDASNSKCSSDYRGRGARLRKMNGVVGNKIDIQPYCGKITTPDGRSFDGKFDSNGRPIIN